MQNIKTLAYDFLLKSEINSLPVTPKKLAAVLVYSNSALLPYSKAEQILGSLPKTIRQEVARAMETNKGITVTLSKSIIILYSDELSYGERLLVVAHEIGHSRIGHKQTGVHLYKGAENDRHESEAQAFAYYLLAPPCVLHATGELCTDKIAQLTGLDRNAAAIVFDILQRDTNKNLVGQEKDLLHQFGQFIESNKSTRPVPTPACIGTARLALAFGSAAQSLHKRIVAVCAILFVVIASLGLILVQVKGPASPVSTAQATTPPPAATQTAPSESEQPTQEGTVWKSKTGDVYHTDPNCYHVPRAAYTMKLSDAIAVGYRKCKDCEE